MISDSLRQNLRRYRFVVRTGATSGGVGERRSKNKGEGIEFEDFRPYTYGDDMRRLDPHVFSRLGQRVIRQYNVSERITISILVDLSSSMDFGAPSKADVARAVAAGLSLCAVANSDALRCGVLCDGRVDWFPLLAGAGRVDDLQAWLISRKTGGPHELAQTLNAALPLLPFGGICVLISDMWDGRMEQVSDLLRSAGQDLVFVRVLSPEEIDPASLGTGPVRFVDVETGDEVEINLSPSTRSAYARIMHARSVHLRELVVASEGRFVDVTTAMSMADVFQLHLRAADVIR